MIPEALSETISPSIERTGTRKMKATVNIYKAIVKLLSGRVIFIDKARIIAIKKSVIKLRLFGSEIGNVMAIEKRFYHNI